MENKVQMSRQTRLIFIVCLAAIIIFAVSCQQICSFVGNATFVQQNNRVYDSFFALPRSKITNLEGGGYGGSFGQGMQNYDYWLKFKFSPSNPPFLKPEHIEIKLEFPCVLHASLAKAAKSAEEDSCYRARQLLQQHFPELLNAEYAASLSCRYYEKNKVTLESNLLILDSNTNTCYFTALR